MKILVAVKPAFDVGQLKFEKDGTPMLDACPVSLGEADRCALEEAIRIKERLGATVAAATIGSSEAHYKAIRDSYAMGADEGYLVKADDPWRLDALSVASAIARLAEVTGPYDLVLAGSGAGDTHASVIGPMIAGILGIPLIAGVDRLEVDSPDTVVGTCKLEDGSYTYSARTPVVVTVTSEANVPRIPNLRAILRSKGMQIREMSAEELGVDLRRLEPLIVRKYEIKRKGIIYKAEDQKGAAEASARLLAALRSEGVLS